MRSRQGVPRFTLAVPRDVFVELILERLPFMMHVNNKVFVSDNTVFPLNTVFCRRIFQVYTHSIP